MTIFNLQDFIDFVSSEDYEGIEKFDLSGWPCLDIKVYGERYNGTVTPELAKSLYDFYMDLQRAYAYIKYGTPNLQKLTLEDKNLFSSIEYRIEEGSLKIFGDISEQVVAMCDSLKGVMDGMESSHKTAVFIVLILSAVGAYSVNEHFDYQAQVAKAESERRQQEIMIDGQKHTVDAMLEQSKYAIDGLSEDAQHRVYGAVDKLNDGYSGIVRSVPDADMLDISGAAMSHEDIEDFIERPKTDTTEGIYEEELKVEQVSKRRFPRISVRFSNSEDVQFTLEFVYGHVTQESYDKIFNSMRDNASVLVKYHALMGEGGILQRGTVLSVSSGSHQSVAAQVDDDDEDIDDQET